VRAGFVVGLAAAIFVPVRLVLTYVLQPTKTSNFI